MQGFFDVVKSLGTARMAAMAAVTLALIGFFSTNGASATIDVAQVQGQVHAQSVKKVGEFAEKNPHEAVSIICSWLHEAAA